MIAKLWLRFFAFLALCFGLAAMSCDSLATVCYDGQQPVSITYDAHLSHASWGFDGTEIQSANKNHRKFAELNAPLAAFSKFLAAEETSASNTFYHYSQAKIPAGQGLNVDSSATSAGNLNAQQAMLNLGINPPNVRLSCNVGEL